MNEIYNNNKKKNISMNIKNLKKNHKKQQQNNIQKHKIVPLYEIEYYCLCFRFFHSFWAKKVALSESYGFFNVPSFVLLMGTYSV